MKKYSKCTNNAIIEEFQNINERQQNLKATIINTGTKTLGHKNITIRKEWITSYN